MYCVKLFLMIFTIFSCLLLFPSAQGYELILLLKLEQLPPKKLTKKRKTDRKKKLKSKRLIGV